VAPPQAGDRWRPFEPVEVQPGLILRLLRREEMEALVPIVLETGLHGDDEARVRAIVVSWWESRLCWPLGLFWQGRPKQYECYHVWPTRNGDFEAVRPTEAKAGFTTHLDLWRPRWFYREAGRVPLERLRAAGIRRMLSFPRADRPDWIRHLTETYGARELGVSRDGRTVALEYDLDRALRGCTGWPERRTAGDAWTWTHAEAHLTLREMRADELDAVHGQLAAFWGGPLHPTVPKVKDALLHRYHLDRATVLLAYQDQALIDAFAMHMRTPERGHHGQLGRFGDMQTALLWRVIYRGVLEWAHAVGYQTLTSSVTRATYEHPTFQRAMQHTRARPIGLLGRQTQMVELARDVRACCAEPLSEWEVLRDGPPLPAFAEIAALRRTKVSDAS